MCLFKNLLPLAVVGSNETVKVGNQYVRARQYPWGVVQGEKRFHLKNYNDREDLDFLREIEFCIEYFR